MTPNHKKSTNNPPKEAFTYSESQQIVQFDILDKSVKVSIYEEIPVIPLEEYSEMVAKSECLAIPDVPSEPHIKLPEASSTEIANYAICDAPLRPNAYIRFIEKSAEELDGEVEYDVDEEDTTWLSIINERRVAQGVNQVSVDTLELLMDRLEKESYFQAAANGQSGNLVDDDAVCCICMDGECQNTNVILFCDMCNLAVHQDCYGVPYIPEGQWLCRRCLQSPSRPVDCVLCPNKGGAFKQTDRSDWAHVVCALWIPEVRFANTVFLEPIDSIENITPARWRLTCYICKQKGVGACIQCHRNNCYTAFHVTCAQQAGLHMRMDTVKTGNESLPITVQKTAFCDSHSPATDDKEEDCKKDNKKSVPVTPEKTREENRNKMKQARKMLAKKRTSVPVILIPTIPAEKIQEIATLVHLPKKTQFLQRLVAYWTLKRQYRNGVPLLRRLQSQGQSSHTGLNARSGIEGSPDTHELYQQLKYWQCLRQDLERARLLCELVRKREKLKCLQMKVNEEIVMIQLNPMEAALTKLLDLLEAKDTSEIFMEPVDTNEVPDYMDIVTHPMDLSTMRLKLNSAVYVTLDQMEEDFKLMIKNCLAYNNRDTIFYRAGVKMRDIGETLFKATRKELTAQGLIEEEKSDEAIYEEIDVELSVILTETPNEKTVTKLQIILDKIQLMQNSSAKSKKLRTIRNEITRAKKTVTAEKIIQQTVVPPTESSQSDGESQKVDLKTPPCSPLKSTHNSGSPSGVNRRTAVLFTRKAQAALKKPTELQLKDENSSCDIPQPLNIPAIKSPKRPGRTKRNSNRKSSETNDDNQQKILSTSSSPKKSEEAKKPPNFEQIPDSFRVYRAQSKPEMSDSDDSNMSFSGTSCSSCSGFSDSNSGTDDDFTSFDEEAEHRSESISSDQEMLAASAAGATTTTTEDPPKLQLEPLQLVWAKCRGYPWYPALIIDPAIPKCFIHNGVPLPAPPQDVLNLRKNYSEDVFLVLFFDAKRTWQWLPANKLELLGLDKQLDQSKLVESRKPTEKKAVKKAYHDALQYQSQVASFPSASSSSTSAITTNSRVSK